LTLEQACLLTTDKQALFADLMGLTKPEYIEWHESQGPVYCSARTKRGKQCRNTIVGATWLQPDEWTTQRTAGGYCAAHGKNMGKAASALAGERYECKTSGPNGTLLQMDGPEEVRRQILVEKKSNLRPTAF
jgi:hypothetical protein